MYLKNLSHMLWTLWRLSAERISVQLPTDVKNIVKILIEIKSCNERRNTTLKTNSCACLRWNKKYASRSEGHLKKIGTYLKQKPLERRSCPY